LKRLSRVCTANTGLKPGAKENWQEIEMRGANVDELRKACASGTGMKSEHGTAKPDDDFDG
jgi:hypothetical protein